MIEQNYHCFLYLNIVKILARVKNYTKTENEKEIEIFK